MPDQTDSGKILRSIAVGVATALIVLFMHVSGMMTAWENRTWDLRCRFLANPAAATDEICLILIDQKSLDWASTVNQLAWPWPRQIYGYILDFCRQGGAKSFAMDVLFSEPSSYGNEDDQLLGKALTDFGPVAGTVFLSNKTGLYTQWPKTVSRSPFLSENLQHESTKHKFPVFTRASFPIPEIANGYKLLANVHLDPDDDGIYRRTRIFNVFDDQVIPSLGLAAWMVSQDSVSTHIASDQIEINGHAIPIDADGFTVLRYRGQTGTHRVYTAASVLRSASLIMEGKAPELDPRVFKDKYVFFGFSAPGLLDLRSTPVSGVQPGVEIHATMLDNFLSRDFIRNVPEYLIILMVIALAFAGAGSSFFFANPAAILMFGLLLIALPVPASLAAYSAGFRAPLLVFEAVGVISLMLNLAVNYATEGRQKRFIKNAFQQYLSPQVIEQLILHPERLKLGGEKRTLSIFFSDIQGFTSISEFLRPEELATLLNTYLTAMTDIITETGGTVDKYEGDAIIAFWNAQLDLPDHAFKCVEAALKCQARLTEMRPAIRQQIGQNLMMRIGMNTGEAVVGNFGSQTKFDYTMLGDAVNLAARLEGTNKQFGTYTMISQFTRDAVGDRFATRELARVMVVGRKEPVTVYEPMFHEDYDRKKNIYQTFKQGLTLFYEGKIEKAADIFSTIAKDDPAAAAYLSKCRDIRITAEWKGIWVMTVK